jgi:DNA-binding HxlR family transcriptional regulator
MLKKKMDLQKLENLLKGVANKNRIKILEYLADEKVKDTGMIADFLDKDYKAVINHLERLQRAGFIQKQRQGLIVDYKITPLGLEILKILNHFKNLLKD